MRALILAGSVALALAGCAQQPKLAIDTSAASAQISTAAAKAKSALDKICANYQYADAVFELVVWSGKVPQKVIGAENAAIEQIAVTCANPPTDARTALAAAERAYATVLAIREQWKT